MRHVVVLGAGPAGLAATQAALAAGARVTLLDEGERSGGQFWRHRPGITDARLQHAWSRFRRLEGALAAADVRTSTSVWSIEVRDGIRVHAVSGPVDGAGRERVVVEADALVVATGAHDRALPMPGWTLPGVTTAGAAQALAKRDGVALGRRTLVAGAGPFLLPVAQSLATVGSRVVEVLEASSATRLAGGWSSRPSELAGLVGKSGELAGYARELLRHRIPYRTGHGVVAIHGDRRVESATVARLDARWRPIEGSQREVVCDAVALGHGFTPRLEAAIAAGCDIGSDRFVVVDGAQATSVAGVFAAGEVTGIAGADAAQAEGVVAGFVAAGGSLDDPRIAAARRGTARGRGFARRLLAAHGIGPGWVSWLRDDTVLCRCESVPVEAVRAVAQHAHRPMRLASRAGLGACQGRTCGRAVEDVVAACGGDARGALDRRPVLGSVRLGEVATMRSTPTVT